MFNVLRRLYIENKLTEQHLINAVLKGWITEDEKTIIINE